MLPEQKHPKPEQNILSDVHVNRSIAPFRKGLQRLRDALPLHFPPKTGEISIARRKCHPTTTYENAIHQHHPKQRAIVNRSIAPFWKWIRKRINEMPIHFPPKLGEISIARRKCHPTTTDGILDFVERVY